MGFVLGADAAVEGTVQFRRGARVSQSVAVVSEPLGSLVLFIV